MAEELKKSLGFVSIVALTITSMIGTSLFFGIGAGVALAGPASIFSWVLIGLVTLYVSACFAELIAMYPSSGGVYEFTKQAYGRFTSFLVGWATWLVANIGAALMVIAAFDFLLPGTGFVWVLGYQIGYTFLKFFGAIAVLLIFNYITYRGVEASGALLFVFAVAMLAMLGVLVVSGFNDFTPEHFAGILDGSPLLVFVAVFFLVESFWGWESASFLAEETKDAERVIPKALLWATGIVIVFSCLIALTVIGAVPPDVLATDPNPILTLANAVLPQAVPLVVAGVFFAFMGGAVAAIVSSPRLLFALARDKLFLAQCTHLHPEHHTPSKAILFQTVVAVIAVVVAFGNYMFLLSMLVPLGLLMYGAVLITVPVLRRKKPHHPRPFTVWGGSWAPALAALLYAAVIVGWFLTATNALSATGMVVGFILFGIPIYLFLTVIYNPDAIVSVNDSAARASLWLEDILLPRSVRRELVSSFGSHLGGKTVLEFGAGVGTFTMTLAEAVGPRGAIIASDVSASNLHILAERARKHGHNVQTVHDEHQMNRVHPDIKRVDVIYSIGFLGYVQDLKKVLREMRQILPANGRICFVEYTNIFKIFPDPAVVADLAKLQADFQEAGFAVAIKRRPGLFWNYLVIEGIKSDRKGVAYV